MTAGREEAASSGFPPIADPGIRVLILGSLPSRRSIAAGQYYGHPRNAFWRIMGDLVGAGPDRPYPQRAARLLAAGIGVWDVLQSSIRPGSMDADIDFQSAKPNDFRHFLEEHPGLGRICFNGRKAAELFRRMDCMPGPATFNGIEFITLPSTSPAFAAMALEEKIARWSVVIEPLETVR